MLLGQYGVVLGGTGSVLGGSDWYLVVQGQYGVVQVGTWWYWVSITQYCLVLSCIESEVLVCLYILEKVEIWSGDTDASLTD